MAFRGIEMTMLLSIFIILFVVELAYFRLAKRFGIVDKPNARSSHSRLTLRGGGIIFPLAVLVGACVYGFAYPWFLTGLVLIAGISFWDDVKPVSNRIRLAVHFLSLLLLFVQWDLFREYPLLVLPFLIVCAGIINAYNFMDGINGITGGYSIVVLTGLAYVNQCESGFVDPNLLYVSFLSLVVFNIFNFRTKAKCFAGDVGSVSIAFSILFFLGSLMLQTRDFSWICFLSVYGVDTVLTILHRLGLKENIFQPHRKHLYQLFANELKIPHLLVSASYLLVQGAIIIGYLAMRPLGPVFAWVYVVSVFGLLSIVYFVIRIRCFHLHNARQNHYDIH